MKRIDEFDITIEQRTQMFKSERDELVSRLTEGINDERVGTPYRPVTKKTVAIRLNKNPILARSNSEIYNLIKDCERNGNYKKFWWATN